MPSDWDQEYVVLGYVAQAHALKGEVKVIMDVHDLEEYLPKKTFYLSPPGESPQRIRITRMNPTGKGKEVLVKIQGVNDRNASEALRGNILYYPTRLLPPLEEGHFYYFEVQGFEVEDKELGIIGTVDRIEDGAAQDLLVILHQGKEVYVPVTDEFVLHADKEKRILYTHVPEGLLELYTGEVSAD